MKYGIFVAYWLKEWSADYQRYIDKAAALGFDILEIQCAALYDRYATDAQLAELRDYAKEKGVIQKKPSREKEKGKKKNQDHPG